MTDLIPLSQSLEFAWVLQQTGRRVLTDNGHLVLQRGTPGLTISLASRARLHDAQDLAAFPSGPLVLSPDHPAPWLWSAGALPLVTAATVAELDLTLDPDARWAMQQPKWRNRLRHAQG
ncbi:MAG: GNAT family N-acetyltransferase, partial [Pseudomonadota bacterium]